MQPLYGYLSTASTPTCSPPWTPIAGLFISSLGLAPSYGWLLLMVALAAWAWPLPPSGLLARHRRHRGEPRQRDGHLVCSGPWFACGPTYFSLVTPGWTGLNVLGGASRLLVCVLLMLVLPKASTIKAQVESHSAWTALRPFWKPLAILYALVFIRSIVQVTFGQLIPLYLHLERGYSVAAPA